MRTLFVVGLVAIVAFVLLNPSPEARQAALDGLGRAIHAALVSRGLA